MSNAGILTMTWMDSIVIWQGKDMFSDASNQVIKVAGWQVCASHSFTEKCVSSDDTFILWEDKGNTTNRVTRCWNYLEMKTVKLVVFLVLEDFSAGRQTTFSISS